MITGKAIYDVFAAVVPLYVAMILGYGSVRWWKLFTPESFGGINSFVAVFAVPLLSFHLISSNNPYAMNFHFIAADSLQKLVVLFALFLWQLFSKRGSLEWTITLFSLSTTPNTLVVGIPLLTAMYGDFSSTLMVQIVVMQSVIWYTLLIFMFEYRGAKILLKEQFPEKAASIASIQVDSDVTSLSNHAQLQADAEIGDDGRLHVVLRRSSTVSSLKSTNISLTPRASNLTGVDIYSLPSTREATPRGSISSFNEAESLGRRCIISDLGDLFNQRRHNFATSDTYKSEITSWPDMITPVTGTVLNEGNSREAKIEVASEFGMNGDASLLAANQNEANFEAKEKLHEMPPADVMIRLGLLMVWRKLTTNLNTYACVIGLVWSLISFRWNIQMPSIVKGSISILSDTGLGMAMFSLGLFMGLQPSIVSCGKRLATFAMAIRFLVGPAVIAATSAAIGLRGTLLQVAILQAALPQAIVTFVFAKEYNVHADIQSTAVIFGLLIALPITIIYYLLLSQ